MSETKNAATAVKEERKEERIMQKLVKNWVFTITVCALLSILSLLMFLDGFGVGEIYMGKRIIHLITAVVLALYVVFVLFPMVARYRGTVQAFLIFEVVILLITVVGQACSDFWNVPLFSTLPVCSVLGLALWLRGVVETVHAYLLRGTDAKKKIPLWGLCLYILLSAVGVWQMVRPLIPDTYFIFCIAGLSLVLATLFGYATAHNRRISGASERARQRRAAKAQKRAAKEAAKASKSTALVVSDKKD